MFGLLDVNDSLEEFEKTMLCNKRRNAKWPPVDFWFVMFLGSTIIIGATRALRIEAVMVEGPQNQLLMITWTFIDLGSFCGIAPSGTPPLPLFRVAALAIQSGSVDYLLTRRGDLAGMDLRRPSAAARSWRGFSTSRTPPRGAAPPTIAPLSLFLKKKPTTFSHFRTPFLMSCTFTASPPRVTWTSSSSAPLSWGHLSSDVHLIGRKWGLVAFQSFMTTVLVKYENRLVSRWSQGSL